MVRIFTWLALMTLVCGCTARFGVSASSGSGAEPAAEETPPADPPPPENGGSGGDEDTTESPPEPSDEDPSATSTGGTTTAGSSADDGGSSDEPAIDTEPPVISTINRAMVSNGATITWPPATDNESASDDVAYLVLYAESDVFGSIEQAMLNATLVGAGGVGDDTFFKGITSVDLSGLDFAKDYWITVIAQDDAGNMSMYPATAASTQWVIEELEPVAPGVSLQRPAGDFYPLEPTVLGNKIIFYASTDRYGWQMFVTDGTRDGTYHLPALLPYTGSGQPALLHATSDLVFFTGTREGTGTTLFRTDGTVSGTWPLLTAGETPNAGMNAGPALTTIGELAFFSTGTRLWRSDGTQAGTIPLQTSTGSDITDFKGAAAVDNDRVLILADEVYLSDGTPAGTTSISTIAPYWDWFDNFANCGGRWCGNNTITFGQIGNQVLFAGDDGMGDIELYKYDGAGSISLVRDINGAGSAMPRKFSNVNGHVVFTINGDEMWKSDGTFAGTVLLNSTDSYFYYYRVAGEFLYYAEGSTIYRQGLTPGDKTPIYTEMSYLTTMYPFGNGVIIEDDGDLQFYNHDDMSTTYLGNYESYDTDQQPNTFAMLDGKMYFNAADLMVTDGTPAGTQPVVNLYNIDLSTEGFHQVGDRLIFPATDATAGIEPHTTDGTVANTSLLIDANAGSGSSTLLGGLTWGANYTLFIDDGTNDRVITTDGIMTNSVGSGDFRYSLTNLPVLLDGELFIPAPEPSLLTTGGAYGVIQDLYGSGNSNPRNMYSLGDRVMFRYFNGSDRTGLATTSGVTTINGFPSGSYYGISTHGFLLSGWQIQSTDYSADWAQLTDINPGGSDQIGAIGVVNDRLIFTADNGSDGKELWTTDGTVMGTTMLADLASGSDSILVMEQVIHDNYAYLLLAINGNSRLVRTNGSPGHLEVIKELDGVGWLGQLKVLNNRILFVEYLDGGGAGIWMGDGTANGTHLAGAVSDLPGLVNVTPVFMTDDLIMVNIYSTDDTSQLYKLTIK